MEQSSKVLEQAARDLKGLAGYVGENFVNEVNRISQEVQKGIRNVNVNTSQETTTSPFDVDYSSEGLSGETSESIIDPWGVRDIQSNNQEKTQIDAVESDCFMRT